VARLGCPLCAKSGREQVQQKPLLDHLVGVAEQRQRNGDAERLSRLEINNHFNFCGLLNWNLRRLCAMKNLAGIDASQTICVDEIGALTDQTASPGEVAKFGASRCAIASCECSNLLRVASENGTNAKDDRACLELRGSRKRCFDFAERMCFKDVDLDSEWRFSFFCVVDDCFRGGVSWVRYQSDRCSAWYG
jgi:hypothetical protein